MGPDLTVSFFVAGEPVPQGSITAMPAGKGQKRAYLYGKDAEAHRRVMAWRGKVAVAGAANEPIKGAVRLTLVFVLPRPPTVTRPLPSTKPDLDKLQRAVFDALQQSGLIEQDSRVVSVVADKVYQDAQSLDVAVHATGVHATVEAMP
jgi:Holliday junction resolvase RusA-like endonuclease